MSWVKAEVEWGLRMAVLTLDCREMLANNMSRAFHSRERSPDLLEAEAMRVVSYFRPDLANCELLSMGFAAERLRWEFLATHPSFERVPLGQEPPSIDLSLPKPEVVHGSAAQEAQAK